jgi:hypothetical protein
MSIRVSSIRIMERHPASQNRIPSKKFNYRDNET